jgi:hypothetical protein
MCASVLLRILCFVSLLYCFLLIVLLNLYPLNFNNRSKFRYFEWQSIDHQPSKIQICPPHAQMSSLLWTHDGTGIMKYIQWISTRKLGNIRITRLNNDCKIIQEECFLPNSKITKFVQIFLISLTANLNYNSMCSTEITRIVNMTARRLHHVYFKRRSIKATVIYHQLDTMRHYHASIISFYTSLQETIEKATYNTKHFPRFFTVNPEVKWTTVNSEDLIQSSLLDCERTLTDFFALLGFDTSASKLKNIIQYDSHQFINESIWWDRSDVAEHILTMSVPSRASVPTYSHDFYFLYGSRSFVQYLSDNRQCYNEGTFAQLQSETLPNRPSSDISERCSLKPFDCAFSDLYSFVDRDQMYQPININHYFNRSPLKCGFAIPSIFDKVRDRYGRNYTCQIIIFTAITNCYDPLPVVQDVIQSSYCFVALLDTQTIDAYKQFYSTKKQPTNPGIKWDFIDLGTNASPFVVSAKSAETLKIVGQRMFPVAKWIIWLDGKAQIVNISEILTQAQAPMIIPPHPDKKRTSASEVEPTIGRIRLREEPSSERLNITVEEILLQEKEYKRDGFYSRSDALGLRLVDIAILVYRNNHPCIFRYLCGWHNEINYFSYRGQLSVYYPGVRLNLTDYLHFLSGNFYSSTDHQAVC